MEEMKNSNFKTCLFVLLFHEARNQAKAIEEMKKIKNRLQHLLMAMRASEQERKNESRHNIATNSQEMKKEEI